MLIKESDENIYLDIKNLEPNREYTKIAYVLDTSSGLDKYENGFYRFFLKDINANKIAARCFNVSDFIKKGIILTYYKRKAAKITFFVTVWQGAYSLIVSDIQPCDEAVDYSKFLGIVEGAESTHSTLEKFLKNQLTTDNVDVTLPATYNTLSLSKIDNGRCGGYIRLLNLVMNCLSGYRSVATIDAKRMFKVLYYVQGYYFNYLKRREEFDIIMPSELTKMITTITLELKDCDVLEIVMDTLMALMNMDKPKHLYANIIYDTFRYFELSLERISLYNTMPESCSMNVGDGVLVKY